MTSQLQHNQVDKVAQLAAAAAEVSTPCTPGEPLQQLHHKQKVGLYWFIFIFLFYEIKFSQTQGFI